MGAGSIITGIFDSIDSGIQTWLDFGLAEEQSNAQPCVQLQKGGPKLEKLRKALARGRAAAELLSSQGRLSVERALDRHGAPDSRYVGVQDFVRAVLADRIPGTSVADLRRRMPVGRPAGTRSGSDTVANRGAKLAEGVYVWAGTGHNDFLYHLAQGELRGDRLRAWWDEWADRTRLDAAPPGEPMWRSELVQLVGDVRGDWAIWTPDLAPQPDSILGIAGEIVSDGETYLAGLIARCEAQQLREQLYPEQALETAETIELERLDVERSRSLLLAAAALLGIAFVVR